MARKLPADPQKRRLQIFKRTYQHMQHWRAQMENGKMGDILQTPDGEEIYYGDLLVGIDTLPQRQRQAFELICLEGYTETAATKIMLPNSRWSTPVQQYADAALARMVTAYDEKQAGTWDPNALPAKRTVASRQKVTIFMSDMSDVLQKHLKAAYDELVAVRDRIAKEIEKVDTLLKGGKP